MSKKNYRKTPLYRLLINLHLYAGLIIGLFVVLNGLSGSAIVFWREIATLMDQPKPVEQIADAPLPLDNIVGKLKTEYPGMQGIWRLKMPPDATRGIVAEYWDPPERANEYAAALYVIVNPYTAEIMSSWYWGETFISWIYNLHMHFHIDHLGHELVGVVGLVLLLLLISGIYLWWPRIVFNKYAFVLSFKVPWPRLEYDIHRLLGLYSAALVLLLVVTGLNLIYPRAVANIVGLFSPVAQTPVSIASTVAPGATPISPSEAANIAQALFPGAWLQGLDIPGAPGDVYKASMRQQSERINKSVPQTAVWIDQYSGEVLHVRDPNKFNAGTRWLSWTYGLHNGEGLGLIGQILVILCGPALAILYVTGVIRWLRRKRIIR